MNRFDTCGPAAFALPAFLAENSYADITSNNKTPFQKGHNTELGAFEWLKEHPKNFNALQVSMTAIQNADWLKGLKVLDQAAQQVMRGSEKPFFVDVGGGHGHQCKQLLEKYPNLHGTVILQDLPQAVDALPPIEGVKVTAQDFFEKQSVHGKQSPTLYQAGRMLIRAVGARFYYLRRIMHDWPDDDCVSILSKLAEAMGGDSQILADEVFMPDTNVPWQASLQDVWMNVLFAGKERTRREWETLIERSGLKLVDVGTYNASSCASVLVLEKA